ncbi:MAG: exopolyphosphatase [Methyloligellaceae bacterium]
MNSFITPLGRLLDSEPISVIDIGSNSVRLVVYEGARRSPAILFNEKVACGLGKSMATSGKLGQESMDRALEALKRFRAVSQQLGSTTINVIATAAAREAANGKSFISEAEKIIGHEVSILSGKEEASFAALGVISGIYQADGMVADMGGGSLEITNVVDQEVRELDTASLGALRMLEESGGDLAEANKLVRNKLKKMDWLGKGKGRALYLVGGTWRAFARLHMEQTSYSLRFVHDYSLTKARTLKFIHLMEHIGASALEGISDIPKARRDTVIYGAIALKGLIEQMDPSEIVFSGYGVREGVLYTLLSEEERSQDPLYAACLDLAVLRSRSPQNMEELSVWTDKLFETAGIREGAYSTRLRHAACLLSDIAWRTHPDYRGTHSINIISQGAFAGVDHPGRVFLALAIFFRHEGRVKTAKLPEIANILDEEDIEIARVLGLAIRVATLVSANMPGILPFTPLVVDDGKLVLKLPKPYTILEGERLMTRLNSLAQLLGCVARLSTDDE